MLIANGLCTRQGRRLISRLLLLPLLLLLLLQPRLPLQLLLLLQLRRWRQPFLLLLQLFGGLPVAGVELLGAAPVARGNADRGRGAGRGAVTSAAGQSGVARGGLSVGPTVPTNMEGARVPMNPTPAPWRNHEAAIREGDDALRQAQRERGAQMETQAARLGLDVDEYLAQVLASQISEVHITSAPEVPDKGKGVSFSWADDANEMAESVQEEQGELEASEAAAAFPRLQSMGKVGESSSSVVTGQVPQMVILPLQDFQGQHEAKQAALTQDKMKAATVQVPRPVSVRIQQRGRRMLDIEKQTATADRVVARDVWNKIRVSVPHDEDLEMFEVKVPAELAKWFFNERGSQTAIKEIMQLVNGEGHTMIYTRHHGPWFIMGLYLAMHPQLKQTRILETKMRHVYLGLGAWARQVQQQPEPVAFLGFLTDWLLSPFGHAEVSKTLDDRAAPIDAPRVDASQGEVTVVSAETAEEKKARAQFLTSLGHRAVEAFTQVKLSSERKRRLDNIVDQVDDTLRQTLGVSKMEMARTILEHVTEHFKGWGQKREEQDVKEWAKLWV